MNILNEKDKTIEIGTSEYRKYRDYDEKDSKLSREERMRRFRNKKITMSLQGGDKNIFYFRPKGIFDEDFENLKQLLQSVLWDKGSPYFKELIELFLWTYEVVYIDIIHSCYNSKIEPLSYLRTARNVSIKPNNFNYKRFFDDMTRLTDIRKYQVFEESFFGYEKKYNDMDGLLLDMRAFLTSQYNKAEKFVLDNEDCIHENKLLFELKSLLEEYKKLDEDKENVVSLSDGVDEEVLMAKAFLKKYGVDDIYKGLDGYVYKQDDAKKSVSLMLFNHMTRLANPEAKLIKKNYLMVGPTGCGKTEITRALKKISPVPVLQIDCGNITGTGWSGANFGDAVKSELENMTEDEKKFIKHGIFVLDEADKMLFGRDDDRDGWWKCKQSSLLKVIEDGKILDKDGNIVIDSTDIVFILAGAFSGMFDDEEGFSVGMDSAKQSEANEKKTFSMLDVSDRIIEFGMMPELAGRVSNLILLNSLNIEDFCYILKNYKKSSVKNQQELYKLSNLKVNFDDEAISEAATQAKERGLGVRGADSILNSAVERAAYKALSKGNKSVRITKKMLVNIQISI